MRSALAVLAMLVAIPACGDDVDDDDSDDDLTDVDAAPDGPSAPGATVTWTSRPAIPGETDDGIVVSAMRYGLMDLRLVGDAGPVPLARAELAWSAGVAPAPDVAADAPAGVYSSLRAMIVRGAAPFAWEISGTADGTPFVLHDTDALALTVPFAATLPAGGGFTVDVRVRVEDIVDDIDFAALPLTGGTRTLGPGDAQLPHVRETIADNFSISDDD